jgi:CspA family cold shock protein
LYIYNLLIFNYNKMSTGTVKFFNETKGFGFIKEDESGKEYFVHVTGLSDKIRENDTVTFDIQEGKKGLNAVNVKLS